MAENFRMYVQQATRVLSMALVTLLLAACAAEAPRKAESWKIFEEALEGNNAKAQAGQAIEEPAMADLLPPINLQLPGQGLLDMEPRFDIKVHRSPAKQFFMSLVEGTPYNMVVHPGVQGEISLDLKNVSIDAVMNVVRKVYGYDYEKDATGYHVYADAMRTRNFKINYLAVKRKSSSEVRVSSGQVTESASNASNGATGGSSSSGSVSGSQVSTQSNSDFWTELNEALKAMVGSGEGRSIVVSPHSGMIVVRAMPEELRAVEQYLRDTQAIVQRQVIIEAKILEVELKEGFQAGINWAALEQTNNNRFLIGQTGGGGSVFDTGYTGIQGNTGTLDPSALNQIVGTTASAFGGAFSLALNISNDFAAFIELLKSQGDVHVLSSPQVSTVNNQKAVIKVGTDEFFVTDIESSTNTTTGTSSTQNNVQLTPFFSGVALDVIPQISDDNNVVLHIHPTVVEVTERTKQINTSTTTSLSVPLAVSTIRESDSIIRARSGQVVIIGGLMQNSTSDNEARVPGLGDIPVVGNLFRHKKQATRKSELVILLRPIVIENDSQWSDQLQKTRGRFRQFWQGQETP
ncbi:MAG: pilus (MSHA type) biogenesis protein MshL [Gammaproteobacteria bacterium]